MFERGPFQVPCVAVDDVKGHEDGNKCEKPGKEPRYPLRMDD